MLLVSVTKNVPESSTKVIKISIISERELKNYAVQNVKAAKSYVQAVFFVT